MNAGRPPRYDAVVATQTDETAPAAITRAQSAAPASSTRGNAPDVGTFRVEASESFAKDPDRRNAKPRAIVDLVSRAIGLDTAYTTGATFDWCRNYAYHRVSFSRRYSQGGTNPDILVDLFANEGQATHEEIAKKQRDIRAHNAEATELIATTMAKIEEQLLLATEVPNPDAFAGKTPDVATKIALAQADAMLYLRREGMVPFGYVPIVGAPREIDRDALLAGGVLDIPPR